MKSMISFVAMAMMMWLLCRASAQIRLQSPRISPPLNFASTNSNPGSTNQPQGKLFRPLPHSPENHPPENPFVRIPPKLFVPGRIPPGVYKTRPYAGIVMVPRGGIDDGILGKTPDTNSNMPVIHPHIEVIPMKRAGP